MVADQVAPAVHNAVLRQRERRRRERLEVLEALPGVLGSTLNVSEVFARVADVTRPAVDVDVMGVALLSANGREVEVIAEVNPGDPVVAPTPPRIPIDGFSMLFRRAPSAAPAES